MPSITKIGKFNKTGKDLLGSGYGELEKNVQARSIGNGSWTAVLEYSKAKDGVIAGTSGSFAFRIAGTDEVFTLPLSAQITKAEYLVTETFTSATDAAVLAIGIPTDDVAGIVAGLAISNASNIWDAGTKLKAGIQTGVLATYSEVTTAERTIVLTNTNAEATTAGALKLVIDYVDLA